MGGNWRFSIGPAPDGHPRPDGAGRSGPGSLALSRR